MGTERKQSTKLYWQEMNKHGHRRGGLGSCILGRFVFFLLFSSFCWGSQNVIVLFASYKTTGQSQPAP